MKRARDERLDDFRDVSRWRGFSSGQVELSLACEPQAADRDPRDAATQGRAKPGYALRLDFDFKGGGGFAVARRELSRALPPSYALRFRLRGAAPRNRFELKLVDASGKSVWWYHRDGFEFPSDWTELRVRSSELEFAWGPAGGGPLCELGALEFAIAAGPGGRGSVWISDLQLEDLTYRAQPRVWASSAARGHPAESALDGSPATSWRSAGTSGPEWLCVDFREPRECGALRLDWLPGGEARSFDVQVSADESEWKTVYSTARAAGASSWLYLPDTLTRYLRLELREPAGRSGFGLSELAVLPREVARSLTSFAQSVARSERRGLHPGYLLGEPSLWTALGAGDGSGTALLDEHGRLEVQRAGFSIEPFLFAGGELVTWADAEIEQRLEEGFLPIPSSRWRARGLVLEVTGFASGSPPAAYVRYRLQSATPRRVSLFAAIRPFQVTPPWQAFESLGGVSPIRELELCDAEVRVNGRTRVIPCTQASGFGAAAFVEGGISQALLRGELPPHEFVRDARGLASGALRFDVELAAGESRDVFLAVPFAEIDAEEGPQLELHGTPPGQRFAAARSAWQASLERPAIRAGTPGQACIAALRTALAHVLINRDGAALQPGPRRYARCWIRDGAVMARALLRTGSSDPVSEFLRGYAPHQRADGAVPCCVDRRGPDWLVEHDSHGQWIAAVAEYVRHSGDRALARELWPGVLAAVQHLAALRASRLTPEFDGDALRARRGLLPESVSHEGYMAHPVHSYWDDFWALRGLEDAAELAGIAGAPESIARIRALRSALRDSLRASIETVRAQRGLDFVPASVEWADHDPTATAMALITTDAADWLPQDALGRTWDLYLDGFRRRRSGAMPWESYTPYEIRNIAALVRLGRRDEAHELLDFFLAERRPLAWNQWPEIAWRDPEAPGHLGDLPHTWVAAEYVLAVLDLFAYERPGDGALVLAAGIPGSWLDHGNEIRVDDLPTSRGSLGYTLRRSPDGELCLSLSGNLTLREGGVIVAPPLPGPLREVHIDGVRVENFAARSVTLAHCPATLRLK